MPIIFTDLDDTLFQTLRKTHDGMGHLECMSTLSDGSPSGYSSEKQLNLISWFQQEMVIPVTARSSKVIARVNIPFDIAVCSNGGAILNKDGSFDAEWHSLLSEQLSPYNISTVYDGVCSTLDGMDVRHWVVYENGIGIYIVIKSNTDPVLLDTVTEKLGYYNKYRFHRNGNNLALIPNIVNKRYAVEYLITKMKVENPHKPIIGVGDSNSDTGFMDLCDFAMAPTNSQLWESVRAENKEWCV